MDKHIRLMERIHNVFDGTKKEFEEARKLNVKKEKYYMRKFVFKQALDLDGNIVENKNKYKLNNTGIEEVSKEIFDYTEVC